MLETSSTASFLLVLPLLLLPTLSNPPSEVISGIATSMGQASGDREPGDFGIDPLKLNDNPQKKAKFQLQEIKNGRLAMWAAAGMILQGVTTSGSALDNLLVSKHFFLLCCWRVKER